MTDTIAMNSYDHLQNKLRGAFNSVSFPYQPPELYDPIIYTLSQGGKRIRPLLVLMGCDLFNGDTDQAMDAAIGIEIFHNFTLLHDDIMDQAPLRRGRETVYKKWNSNVAILSGDTMFALAMDYVSRIDATVLPEALALFARTAREVCEGQQYDMTFEKQEVVSIEDYLRMIRLKTAVLLACSLKLGALIARTDMAGQNNIYLFGENLGLAFQLQDDLLDTFGDGGKFGKEIGGDIVANKKTYLYIKALELADKNLRQELIGFYTWKDLDVAEKILKVRNIFSSLDLEKITRTEIMRYVEKALSSLGAIDVPEEKKQDLREFTDKLVTRDY